MRPKNYQYYLKYAILWFFSLLLIISYLFLIVWTYCYSLYVYYLLAAAFGACIIIYIFQKSAKKAIKFLLLGLVLFFVLSPFNLKQFNKRSEALQIKVNDGFELSTKEKLGVYGCLLMMIVIEWVPFPEASIENYYMLFPSANGERIFYDQDILKSPSIQRAMKLKTKSRIYWSRWDFVYNRDFRYAMAFDPCTVKITEENGNKSLVLSTEVSFRENFTSIHATRALRGIFEFRVDEGLLWYLQERGWIYPYTASWVAKM